MKNRWQAFRKNPRKTIKRILLAVVGGLALLTIALYFSIRGQIVLRSWPATPILEDRYGRYLAEASHEENQKGFWDVTGPLPERITACIIAIEDRRFDRHSGVDLHALARAAWHTLSGKGREGASTIAMQVARLQNPGRRTLWKKACELVIARLLVGRYGREQVLRHYLKIMPQGNQIFGAAYAARRYFQKPLSDLSWAEAALLAAIAKAPGKMNPFHPYGLFLAKKRARIILKLLQQNGRLTAQDLAEQTDILNQLPLPQVETRPFHSYHAILRLYEELSDHAVRRFTRPVRTSLDIELQEYLDRVAGAAMEYYRKFGAGNIAIIVADRESGRIRGYLGSEDYFNADCSGSINYARIPRSAGSTLKPFIFALGLADHKYTPASIIPDLPLTITHESGDYSIINFDDSYLGPLLYRRALANSRNIPAVRVLKTVGLERSYDLFCRLGLADPVKKASYYGLNMAVGGLYVTLEDLVRSYGVLANGGRAFSLSWFEEPPPRQHAEQRERFFPEEIARLTTLFLSDPLARLPSFSRMSDLEYHFPVAVKTGTSQGFRDAWTVAFSSKYLVGIWLGHPANDRMKNVQGQAAAGIAKHILVHLQPEENRSIHENPFPKPPGYEAVRLCPLSGQLAGDLCPEAVLEYFPAHDMPADVCSVHQRFAVDRRTGRLADAGTPSAQVRMKTCLVLPPEYAIWANRKGLGVPPRGKTDIRAASVFISNPVPGSRFFFDPETPLQYQTLPLKAVVMPQVPRLDWYVDGRFLASTPYPYETRWTIQPGEHIIEARFPRAFLSSPPVRITVR